MQCFVQKIKSKCASALQHHTVTPHGKHNPIHQQLNLNSTRVLCDWLSLCNILMGFLLNNISLWHPGEPAGKQTAASDSDKCRTTLRLQSSCNYRQKCSIFYFIAATTAQPLSKTCFINLHWLCCSVSRSNGIIVEKGQQSFAEKQHWKKNFTNKKMIHYKHFWQVYT